MELQRDATFVQDVTSSTAHTDDKIRHSDSAIQSNFPFEDKLSQICADKNSLISLGGGLNDYNVVVS